MNIIIIIYYDTIGQIHKDYVSTNTNKSKFFKIKCITLVWLGFVYILFTSFSFEFLLHNVSAVSQQY